MTATTSGPASSTSAAAPASTASSRFAVDLTGAAFQLDRLFVEVFEESAEDGSEINKVTVPVIYGPRIVPGYVGYRLHTVKRGDTLSKIANDAYGSDTHFDRIVRANPLVISDPNRIFVGQVLKIPIGCVSAITPSPSP